VSLPSSIPWQHFVGGLFVSCITAPIRCTQTLQLAMLISLVKLTYSTWTFVLLGHTNCPLMKFHGERK
jgi:hypothetical protein